jgi:hypothetical protein
MVKPRRAASDNQIVTYLGVKWRLLEYRRVKNEDIFIADTYSKMPRAILQQFMHKGHKVLNASEFPWLVGEKRQIVEKVTNG